MLTDVLAVVCADVHLDHRAPAGRRTEEDWYAAMARNLKQVDQIAAQYEVPVFCAGDIFHRHNPPPSLINFAIEHLPRMYSVPGQHDQQHHRKDLSRTAYLTLVKAGVLTPLSGVPTMLEDLAVWGFGWGDEIVPVARDEWDADVFHLAIIHRYCATQATAHPGADKRSRPSAMRRMLKGYDVAVFGDNHVPFETRLADCLVYNCGCLIQRSRAERINTPSVGLVKRDGSVDRVYLDCSVDVWVDDMEDELPRALDFSGFVADLKNLDQDDLDYLTALRHAAKSETKDVQSVLYSVLEDL